MKRTTLFLKNIQFLLIALIGFLLLSNPVEAKNQRNKILFISSYSYDWSSVPKQLDGISKELDDSIDIDYIFMDAKNRSEDEASKDLIEQLREQTSRYGKLQYDLVLLGDDPAIDVCLAHKEEFFHQLPIVFFGSNSMEKALRIAKDPYITGVAEHIPIRETIELAQKLYPDAKNVVGISNTTNTGIGSLEQFYSCEKDFPDLKFSDVNTLEYSIEELQTLVSTYNTDTILLCLMFDRDKNGEKFQMEQGVSWLYSSAKIPIFRADELAIENGSIGGCVISFEDMGQKAAKIAKDILNGKDPEYINVVDMPSFYELNWKVMQRFHISKNQLPKENVRYNQYVPDFWETNSQWILSFLFILLIAGIIITILLYENNRKRRLNTKLLELANSLDAAIGISNFVFFEYFPDRHYADRLSKNDPLLIGHSLSNYPDVWIASGILHPEDVEEYRSLFHKIDSGADYAEAEVRNKCNGTYHWYQYCLKSIYDSNNDRIKVIGARSDITLVKEIEASYQKRINAFFASSPNTLASCHLNLTQNKVSELTVKEGSMQKILMNASTFDDIINSIAQNIYSRSDREKYLQTFSADNLISEYQKGNTSINMDFRCTLNNEPHWINASVEMNVEPKHSEIDAICHAVDITYNKVLELLLESVASHDYDTLSFIFGKTQRFASYSWLYPKELVMQENYNQVLLENINKFPLEDKEDICQKLQWNTIIENLNTYGEYTVFFTQCYGDAKRHKKLQFLYIDEKEQLILSSQRDITDIYENEVKQKEALTLALEKANVANAAKTDFLSRMSHDMRTPMNAIIGITALALEEIDNPEAVTQNLNKINSASHFLLSLINDILDMTKIEDGAVELHNEVYYHEDFIENLRTMFEPLCQKNGISLIFECKNDDALPVLADKMRINQIFFNIMSNAIKFTPEGGKIIYREENITVKDNFLCGDYSVIDTGIGMNKDFLEKVFQPFVQEDNGITSNIEGTGLGLSITKSLVDLMGGNITIESEKGKGTKITIHLECEIYHNNSDDTSATAKNNIVDQNLLKGKRVLLVEDHPLNTEIATRILAKKDIIVVTAENGEVALNRFKSSKSYFFDAILMDIRMPVMDGLTTAREIRKLDKDDAKDIPIIAMTANAYAEDIQQSKEAGMNAHLAKPIEPEKLYQTLAEKLIERNNLLKRH